MIREKRKAAFGAATSKGGGKPGQTAETRHPHYEGTERKCQVKRKAAWNGWLHRLSEAAHDAGKWPDGDIPLTEEEARQLYKLWEEFDGSMATFVEAYL